MKNADPSPQQFILSGQGRNWFLFSFSVSLRSLTAPQLDITYIFIRFCCFYLCLLVAHGSEIWFVAQRVFTVSNSLAVFSSVHICLSPTAPLYSAALARSTVSLCRYQCRFSVTHRKVLNIINRYIAVSLQSLMWNPTSMKVLMLERHWRTAGTFCKMAFKDSHWHDQWVFEICICSGGCKPSWFWTSLNLWWFMSGALKNEYSLCNRSNKSLASGTAWQMWLRTRFHWCAHECTSMASGWLTPLTSNCTIHNCCTIILVYHNIKFAQFYHGQQTLLYSTFNHIADTYTYV